MIIGNSDKSKELKNTILFMIATTLGAAIFMLLWTSNTRGSGPDRYASGMTMGEALENETETQVGKIENSLGEMRDELTVVKMKPLIQEVHADRRTVCPGEDVLLRAFPREDGPPLRYVIQGEPGEQTINRWDEPGEKTIVAVAREGLDAIDYMHTKIQVRDPEDAECIGRPQVTLEARPATGMANHADFEITKLVGLEGPFRFDWDFGDRVRRQGTDRYVRHDYGARKQDRFVSAFVAQVKVTDANGDTAMARASVPMANAHYLARLSGSPVMPVSYDRFPKKTAGAFVTHGRFTNLEDQSVDFAHARLEVFACQGGQRSRDIQQIAAGRILEQTRIGAGRTETIAIRVPLSLVGEKSCQTRIVLETDRLPGAERGIIAELALELGVPAATEDESQFGSEVIEDQELGTKIAKAAEILGRPQVTPADLKLLEKQGKL